MWDEKKIIEYLQNKLKYSRFIHSLGVRDTAFEFASLYGVDKNKAYIAGLIHDCAKYMSDEDILNILKKNNVCIDNVTKVNPNIMHGYASAYIAKHIMGICDKDILNAVIYHTTGKADMTKLEKIIYLADYTEPSRKFPGVIELRNLSRIDLDKALIRALDNTITYVIKNGWLLHVKTIEARNYLICHSGR